MHNRLSRVVGEKETERARNLGLRITSIRAMVIIRLVFEIVPSSRSGTSTQVILLLLRTLIQKREMIEMPSVIESRVIVVDCMEVSAL